MSREEIFFSKDCGKYFAIQLDDRELNYDLYFKIGKKNINNISDYTSENTDQLDKFKTINLLKPLIKNLNVVQKYYMKNKILIILGTRPEIIRLSCIMKKIEKYFLSVVVNTNQNFDKNLNRVFFKQLSLKEPNYSFPKKKYKNSTNFIANAMKLVDSIIEYEKPNAVLVLGDTNSALTVLSAKKRKIPIFHIEAGNRCYDQRVPEEINRILIDKISDINMVYSDVAKNNLIKENFDLDKILIL